MIDLLFSIIWLVINIITYKFIGFEIYVVVILSAIMLKSILKEDKEKKENGYTSKR